MEIPLWLNTAIFRMRKKIEKIVFPEKKTDYKDYWENRYKKGGNSGSGSYGHLAEFKAEIINGFIKENKIQTVTEVGCGDGNQLRLMDYKSYIGLDISTSAIDRCKKIFEKDKAKKFFVYSPDEKAKRYRSDLVVCLDVLYHILDERDYMSTISYIIGSAEKYIILYTSSFDADNSKSGHIKRRDVMKTLAAFKDIEIIEVIKNRYPKESDSDFIMIKKIIPHGKASSGAP